VTTTDEQPWAAPAAEPDPRRIEWLPLEEIQEDPDNPKDHDQEIIGASVKRHGVIDLMTRDDRTGYLISGHGRLHAIRARREAGDPPPAGVRQTPDGSWLVPVVVGWASSDDLDARAALITLNRSTELGGWVDDSLLQLLDDLREADAMEAVGFTDLEIETLRRKLEAENVFTAGTEHMLDEFRGISGQNESGYSARFTQKVVVYLRDDAAVADFKARLGLTTLGADLDLPLGWSRNG